MAYQSAISWTNSTWNPITGCSRVSKGCENCYAERLAATRMKHHPSRKGLTDEHERWNGTVRFNEQWLADPLKWRKPRMIFVCAHSDLFHENVPDHWIDRVLGVAAAANRHVFQVLTKRPDRMRKYFMAPSALERIASAGAAECENGDEVLNYLTTSPLPLPNVWLGVSAEDQKTADERIPVLLDTPAAVRWLSAEPLLGPINLCPLRISDTRYGYDEPASLYALRGEGAYQIPGSHWIENANRLDLVIVGGESGPKFRSMNLDWARSLRDQCVSTGVSFFFKQVGGRTSKAGGALLDGREWRQMPSNFGGDQ